MVAADRSDIGRPSPIASSTALYLSNAALSPPTQIASLPSRAGGAAAHRRIQHIRALTGERRVKLFHDARRIGREVETSRVLADAGEQAVVAGRDASTSAGSGSEVNSTSHCLGDLARRIGPHRAGVEMMAGRLPVQVMHHELVAGLLAGWRPSCHPWCRAR